MHYMAPGGSKEDFWAETFLSSISNFHYLLILTYYPLLGFDKMRQTIPRSFCLNYMHKIMAGGQVRYRKSKRMRNGKRKWGSFCQRCGEAL